MGRRESSKLSFEGLKDDQGRKVGIRHGKWKALNNRRLRSSGVSKHLFRKVQTMEASF